MYGLFFIHSSGKRDKDVLAGWKVSVYFKFLSI